MGATHTEICAAYTSYSAAPIRRRKLAAMPARSTLLLMALLPMVAVAAGETARIEIARGKHPFVTLTGADTAGQFTVWSGTGTGGEHPGDIADWADGAVAPPDGLTVFNVRFFCTADASTPREAVTSHQCYGVYYGIDPHSRAGFIRIPPAADRTFPGNTRSIYQGVEGGWYRASGR